MGGLLLPPEEVISELNALGFTGFQQTDNAVEAYIPRDTFEDNLNKNYVLAFLRDRSFLSIKELPPVNWNAKWEEDFEPATVGEFCQIVPAFKAPSDGFQHTVTILPRMAFGTGHHPTTRLMIEFLRELPATGQQVLDLGCGTGVLGVLALQQGATQVTFADHDPIAIENTLETLELNNFSATHSAVGGLYTATPEELLQQAPGPYTYIIANILAKVLLQAAPTIDKLLAGGGVLFLSGILEENLPELQSTFAKLDIQLVSKRTEADWYALHLQKQAASPGFPSA